MGHSAGGRARELGYTLQGTSAARAAGSGVRGWEEAHSPGQLLPAGVKGPASRKGPTPPGWEGLKLGVYLPVWPFLAPGGGGLGPRKMDSEFTHMDFHLLRPQFPSYASSPSEPQCSPSAPLGPQCPPLTRAEETQTGRAVALRNPISWLPEGNRHRPLPEDGQGQTRYLISSLPACLPWSAQAMMDTTWGLGSVRATAGKVPPVQGSYDFSYTASLRSVRKMHLD